ncbi:hypothetical protein [Asaccharospora irregularis]|uniref:Uncharacterized protein n=1 Tax=Asaccharospora irregularis DSM 2635 TaxID=1121321 RepID=A0A1M5SCH1_9FIRM|nr:MULTISPECIES: hypothetical protein [Peptostreptococcaceae]SHH36161.1 hypothetical protein SAMN04488530_13914 [Asaccharospora irregularis DSM 2635]
MRIIEYGDIKAIKEDGENASNDEEAVPTSKQYAESIQTLSYRVENVEQGNGRIEQKLDIM